MSLSRITLGMQCFWGAEALFGSLDGVATTRVGYAGGSTKQPTYRNLADHIEAVDILFESSKITPENILNVFFKSHDPTTKYKRQYISAIFYQNEAEKKFAQEYIQKQSNNFSKPIVTEIVKLDEFTNAEDYHQKYFFRKYPVLNQSLKLTDQQIITSPIATKLNGFCAGFGTVEQVKRFIDFDFSQDNYQLVEQLVKNGPDLHECGI